MIDALRYSAAYASIQADIGNLFSEPAWNDLLRASGLEERVSLLAGGVYGQAVAQGGTDRERLERQLRAEPARSFLLPLAFLRGKARALVEWRLRELEVENLVRVVRKIHHGMPAQRSVASLPLPGEISELDWRALGGERSISDLIERLARTPAGEDFARSLERAEGRYERSGSVAVLELALAIDYYRKLRRLVDRLKGSDRRHAVSLVGPLIDDGNLLWTLRCRFYFGFGPETILGTTLPESDRLPGAVLQRAASGAPVADVVEDAFGKDFTGLAELHDKPPEEAIKALSLIFTRRRYDRCSSRLAGKSANLGAVLAYLEVRTLEAEDLIAVFEGGNYGWSEEMIRSRLAGAARRT